VPALTGGVGAGKIAAVNITPEILSLIDEIRHDKTHGASELARRAVEVLKLAAERSQANSVEQFLAEQRAVGERLKSSRPAMAPVFNIISYLLDIIEKESLEMEFDSIRRVAISKADELINGSLQAVAWVAGYGSELIADGDIIMTHSYSSTVMAMLKTAFTKCGNIEVVTTRSGPGRTGEGIAQQLGLYGIPVTFIDDTAVGVYISKVNKVIVGADRVCVDGKLVNGAGTYQLALAAEKVGVPFYVLCETLKFDSRLKGDEVDLEEKEPSEVIEPGRLPAGVRVKNPYFDITPVELITAIVTENGLLTPEELIRCLEKLPVKDS
jgi:eIF-2B alpha/beta/delta-like uncharacterized protein